MQKHSWFRHCLNLFVRSAGLNLLPGSKRKHNAGQWDATPTSYDNSANPENLMKPKRAREMHHKTYGLSDSNMCASDMCATDSSVDSPSDEDRPSRLGCLQSPPSLVSLQTPPPSLGCLQTPPSACAVEDSLSKGFEGHLSIGRCFQFGRKSRLSYTWTFSQVRKKLEICDIVLCSLVFAPSTAIHLILALFFCTSTYVTS